MERAMAQENQTQFRLKLGNAEIEFVGDAEFLKNEIMPAVAKIVAVAETRSGNFTAELPYSKQIGVSQDNNNRQSKPNSPNGKDGTNSVEFRHDPNNFGTPKQSWNTQKKAVWLLHIVSKQADINDLSTIQIVTTFNSQFRQAKTVTNSNVSRDLGKAKTATPSLVGEDVTKNPSHWFLTDEGSRYAEKLIVENNSAAGI
jgi:hypothetical protein